MAVLKFKVVPKKNPMTGDFKYYGQKDTYTTIDDRKLLERIAANTAVPAGVIRAASDAIFDTIMNFVLNGHSVQFGDFMNLRPAIKCKMYKGDKDPNDLSLYGKLGGQSLRIIIRATWRSPVRELQKPANYEFRRIDQKE